MRTVAVAAGIALLAAASVTAAPERSAQYHGWRYGPISGAATLITTGPPLLCPNEDVGTERRVLRGTYRLSFTGKSMRQIRAAADIDFSLAAGGPAGNTESIALRMRQSSEETVQVRTVTEDDEGNLSCTLRDEPCTSSETKNWRRASNRLNVQMRPRSRVFIYPGLPGGGPFSTCARGVADPNRAWDVVRLGKTLPLAPFNRPRGTLRFAWSGRVRGETEGGVQFSGTLTYRAAVGLVRLPGTPRARCRVC